MTSFLNEVHDTLRWVDESDEPLAFDKTGMCCISVDLQAYFRVEVGYDTISLDLCRKVSSSGLEVVFPMAVIKSSGKVSDIVVTAHHGVLQFAFEYEKKSFLLPKAGRVRIEERFNYDMKHLGGEMRVVA